MAGIKAFVVGLGMVAGAAAGLATAANAQVAYQPYALPGVTPYGYPVGSGFLQPNETAGTSPSFVIMPGAYGPPGVGIVQRCQYPDGWNVTDFDRDVSGIPNGIDHTCPTPPLSRAAVRSRY